MDLTRLKASLHPDITATEIDARQMVNGMLYEYEGKVIGDFQIAGDKIALIAFLDKEAILVEPGTKVKATGRPAVTLTQAQAMRAQLDLFFRFIDYLAWNRGVVAFKPANPEDPSEILVDGHPVTIRGEQAVRAVVGPPELVKIAYRDYSLTTPEIEKAIVSVFPNFPDFSA